MASFLGMTQDVGASENVPATVQYTRGGLGRATARGRRR